MIQKKSLIFIIAIIILTAGIAAAGIYMAKKIAQPEGEDEEVTTEESIAPQPLPTEEEEMTPTAEIDTSDWKTYRNEGYGFELSLIHI